jgi:hypothetical protein
MSLQGSLSIERMCQLAQVSRAGPIIAGAFTSRGRDGSEVHDAADRAGASAPLMI